MDKKFNCRNMGMDCDYTVCARTEEDVLEKVADHAQAFHQMKGFSKELYEKAMGTIYDGYCVGEEDPLDACCCSL